MIEIKNITEYIQLLKRIASRTPILASPGLLVVPTVTIAQISDCWKELAESERKFVLDFNCHPINPLPEAQALFQKDRSLDEAELQPLPHQSGNATPEMP